MGPAWQRVRAASGPRRGAGPRPGWVREGEWEGGPRERGAGPERRKTFFFLFKKALNQILHHIYKPKFDLLT